MRAIVRSGLSALAVAACLPAVARVSSAQVTPPGATARPPATAKAAATARAPLPVRPPDSVLKQPMATVNGEVITRAELLQFLNRYQIPAGNERDAYRDAMDTLVNTHLINQFLTHLGIPVSREKLSREIATLKTQLKQDGTDLPTQLLQNGLALDEVEKEYANRIRWVDYLNSRATDAELKKFAANRKDLFSGTQVKASHILLKVDPKADAAEKAKVRQKLLGIAKDVESKKMTFAEAANKYSEDPANSEGAGGDVGYFTLNSGFIDEFANAAFAMKKGAISDPVETPYGYHLIQVTDRVEGKPLDFEQNKLFVKQMYAAELQKNLLLAQRKVAKIDVKPMPTDLFPPAQSETPAAAPASRPAARPGTPK